MWKVEVSEYYWQAQESTTYREFFNSKKDALDYCDMLKALNLNADITLEDMTPVDGCSYPYGEVVWIQKATVR